MRNVISICKRELLSFFVSPIGYFVITGFILLGGFFFFNYLGWFNRVILMYQSMPFTAGMDLPNLNQTVIEGFLQTLILILVFLVPLLTMRTLADEKRKGTFELLITSPVTVNEIVIGKFLSLVVVLAIMSLLAFCFPLLLAVYGNPELYPILTGCAAVFICAVAFASIGMAVSSFTENQTVAGMSSMVILLLLYVIQAPAESLGGSAAAVLKYLSPVEQVRGMIEGVVSINFFVYFVSLTALGIFLSQRALEAHRWR